MSGSRAEKDAGEGMIKLKSSHDPENAITLWLKSTAPVRVVVAPILQTAARVALIPGLNLQELPRF